MNEEADSFIIPKDLISNEYRMICMEVDPLRNRWKVNPTSFWNLKCSERIIELSKKPDRLVLSEMCFCDCSFYFFP